MKKTLNERTQKLLNLLVDSYIRDGQPVASKKLASDAALPLSPASIRNMMADLEKSGYICSPHTSAGRVPTEQGYRLFVDNLLTTKPLQYKELANLKISLDPDRDDSSLVETASSLLSDITQLAGLVTAPKRNRVNLRRVEFLPMTQNKILTILVFDKREVQNRIIYTDKKYSPAELEQAANYVNEQYVGKDLLAIRRDLVAAMKDNRHEMNGMMKAAINVANKAFKEDGEPKSYIMAGQSNLLSLTAVESLDRLKALFDAFSKKQSILHLLDKCLHADGMQIFIGKEAGYDFFEDFSVVAKPYEVDGEVLGVLGVIGPSRMPYDQVISAVDITARLLSKALK
jgi:heat-inducible transcriptional repressor